jgi:beta-phosphoglucomutase family hydrolase
LADRAVQNHLSMLGLPSSIRVCLFDMDGVLTRTATVHAAAWKEMFDEYLAKCAGPGETFVPFDSGVDYLAYIDGKPRADGVRSFLASRGIALAEDEVAALGDRKNALVQTMIRRVGVEVFEGSVRYVRAAREAGLRTGVVSASENTREVLKVARIEVLFDVCVDGVVAKEQGLRGKPAADTFLAAARALDARPEHAAVFEDALAGVEAGRAGSFGLVVGVDRAGHAEALLEHGADIVVQDLAELLERP